MPKMPGHGPREKGRAYSCWLCGYRLAADADLDAMRGKQCPRCKLEGAFLPCQDESKPVVLAATPASTSLGLLLDDWE